MFLNKKNKEIKQTNKIIETRINQINTIIEYLISSYYLDPNRKIDKLEIYDNFNDGDKMMIDLFLSELKNKKKIMGKNKFVITFDCLIYLEDLIRKRNEHKYNKIAILLSYGAFAMSFFGIMDHMVAGILSMILGGTIILVVYKLIVKNNK